MNKLLITLTLLCFSFHTLLLGQACGSSFGINLGSQTAVDNFAINNPGCTETNEDLNIITTPGSNDPITNLNGISSLTKINGNLTLGLNSLTDLQGLANINEITGNFAILNSSIQSFNGIGSFVNGTTTDPLIITISDSPNLTSMQGLEGITRIRNLNINGCNNLTSLNGLQNMTKGSNRFTSMINGRMSLGISNNPLLTNLDVLSNYIGSAQMNITNNASLVSIDGLQNMETCESTVNISNNPLLSVCNNDFICEFFQKGYHNFATFAHEISNNAPGCNSISELLGLCGPLQPDLIDTTIFFCEGTSVELNGVFHTQDTLVCNNVNNGFVGVGGANCFDIVCTEIIELPAPDVFAVPTGSTNLNCGDTNSTVSINAIIGPGENINDLFLSWSTNNGFSSNNLTVDVNEADSYFLSALNITNSCITTSLIVVECNECPPTLNVNINPIDDATYKASDQLMSNSLVPVNGNVFFEAGTQIKLENGFKVINSATFKASLENCAN